MNDLGLIVMDIVMACVFGVLGVVALVGVVLGAWWHLGTAAMCGVMVWMLVAEARGELNRTHKSGRYK